MICPHFSFFMAELEIKTRSSLQYFFPSHTTPVFPTPKIQTIMSMIPFLGVPLIKHMI